MFSPNPDRGYLHSILQLVCTNATTSSTKSHLPGKYLPLGSASQPIANLLILGADVCTCPLGLLSGRPYLSASILLLGVMFRDSLSDSALEENRGLLPLGM